VFKFRCKQVDDFNTWVYRLLKNLEKSRGVLLKLGLDEKLFQVKSWRVRFDGIK
jgi:hypothetical protein